MNDINLIKHQKIKDVMNSALRVIANLSGDHRQKVGSILVSPTRLAMEYDKFPTNFSIGDLANIVLTAYNTTIGDLPYISEVTNKSGAWVIHSEENLLLGMSNLEFRPILDKEIRPYKDMTLFVTHAPCIRCMSRIIMQGEIKRIVYINSHDDNESIAFAEKFAPRMEVMHFDDFKFYPM